MAYILGSTTLPRPKRLYIEIVEKSAKIVTLNNITKKDITGRKNRYILEFGLLTQAEVASIMAEYNDIAIKNFQSTESNMMISATPVHVEIERKEYNTGGNEYREDFTLILEEVS